MREKVEENKVGLNYFPKLACERVTMFWVQIISSEGKYFLNTSYMASYIDIECQCKYEGVSWYSLSQNKIEVTHMNYDDARN